MKIIIFVNAASGVYDFRSALVKQLLDRGDKVVSVLPTKVEDGEAFCESKLIELGTSIIHAKLDRRGMNPVKDFALFRTYRKILREEKPDVVLLYTVKPNVYGGLACRMMRVPYISTITGLGTTLENPGLVRSLVVFLYRLGLKKASAVMFQNATNMGLFRDLKIGRNYRLVPGSGVDLSVHTFEEYPSKDAPVNLTFAGRIMRDKGIGELLEAAKAIKARHPEVNFNLIGGFDESYQSAVEEAEREGTVKYLGVQKIMHGFYKDCSAVLMPSYHEGICNVCLEGAATGRPVLASNVPGCKETFDEGVSGIGFEAKSASALTEAIEKFLALPYADKVAMGLASRKKMESEFDRKIVITLYLEEIGKIINKSKGV